MINANQLIEAIQAKIDFRKRYLIFRTEDENKEDMAEIKAYEDVICLVKAGGKDV